MLERTVSGRGDGEDAVVAVDVLVEIRDTPRKRCIVAGRGNAIGRRKENVMVDGDCENAIFDFTHM